MLLLVSSSFTISLSKHAPYLVPCYPYSPSQASTTAMPKSNAIDRMGNTYLEEAEEDLPTQPSALEFLSQFGELVTMVMVVAGTAVVIVLRSRSSSEFDMTGVSVGWNGGMVIHASRGSGVPMRVPQ